MTVIYSKRKIPLNKTSDTTFCKYSSEPKHISGIYYGRFPKNPSTYSIRKNMKQR